MIINIDVEVDGRFGFDYSETARAVIEEVLKSENCPYEAEVSIVLTDNSGIRRLNSEYRRIDMATDVLSFPMADFEQPADFTPFENDRSAFNPENGAFVLGDIVISTDKVKAQASEYGHSVKREFAFLIAHSMYHLLGYDHENSDEEADIMNKKQEEVLDSLGISREKKDSAFVRARFKDKKRIVIKIGSSSLTHKSTGLLDLVKLEQLVRELTNLRNQGKEVVLVSSGAIMVGRNTLGLKEKPTNVNLKQACASVGQAKLMMIYQKLFSEYNQICSQVLLTKSSMTNNLHRYNAKNTFKELLSLGVIPIVNENDTIATRELSHLSSFGDNDTLSAVVTALINADLLILLSDIDGLYTDNPNENKDAEFVEMVEKIDDKFIEMGKSTTGSNVGTGGMATKLSAAKVAVASGADMVIASGDDFRVIHEIINGDNKGTLFLSDPRDEFFVLDYIEHYL